MPGCTADGCTTGPESLRLASVRRCDGSCAPTSIGVVVVLVASAPVLSASTCPSRLQAGRAPARGTDRLVDHGLLVRAPAVPHEEAVDGVVRGHGAERVRRRRELEVQDGARVVEVVLLNILPTEMLMQGIVRVHGRRMHCRAQEFQAGEREAMGCAHQRASASRCSPTHRRTQEDAH